MKFLQLVQNLKFSVAHIPPKILPATSSHFLPPFVVLSSSAEPCLWHENTRNRCRRQLLAGVFAIVLLGQHNSCHHLFPVVVVGCAFHYWCCVQLKKKQRRLRIHPHSQASSKPTSWSLSSNETNAKNHHIRTLIYSTTHRPQHSVSHRPGLVC